MTDVHSIGRRRFVAVGGALVATALAGCSGDGDGGGGGDYDFLGDEPDYGDWFDDVDNYEGTVDWTGRDAVTVDVGTGPNGFQYEPAAIAVDPGTTVTWEWTGAGGEHNVAAEDDSYQSPDSQAEGFTFEWTFDESGVSEYYCVPHRAMGMKGAVYVP